jgi:pimeloyl-ACP methyl ester carboxylesterase
MVEDCAREHATTYALRPELKNLKAPTLFLYGEKDMEGPSSLAREMAALVANAHCEIISRCWTSRLARSTEHLLKNHQGVSQIASDDLND